MTRVIDTAERWPNLAAITVNGVTILRALIAQEAQHHPAPSPAAALAAAARALVVKELLMQEARRSNVAAEPVTDDAGRRETEHEAIIRALIERDVMTPEPDKESCRRYFAQNRRRFRSPDIFEASHILFAARADHAEAYASSRAAAEDVLAVLGEQPTAFADLARKYSTCPSAAQGGNLGQITAGDTTPEFEQALFALEPGAISPEPIATRYGHHIIRLDGKHPGRELPYELCADLVANYLRESVRRRAIAQYIARLVSAARIEGIDLAGSEALRVF